MPEPMDDVRTCVLERIVEADDAMRNGTLIGLHDECSTHADIVPFLRLIADGRRVIAPRSARWAGYGQGGRYSWFSSVAPPFIEPIGFGDSLMQLESFVLEHHCAVAVRGTTIVGIGQGGTMAIALAALWPELFRAVVAVDASWPEVRGWHLPERDMSGMTLLVVAGGSEVRQRLIARHGRVDAVDRVEPGEALVQVCRQWMSNRELLEVESHR